MDIVEVGAGGGSIAWIDDSGALKVGPRSAAAVPGPAGYGRGGKEPTVTDANLVLGRIDAEYFLGGGIHLLKDRAVEAIKECIGNPLGLGLEEAALGILTIANYNMSIAVRAVTVERGYDPRDCVLVASGGGGPLHAGAIARELSVPRVVIPPMPAHFSALGMLLTDLKHDYVQTCLRELSETSGRELAGWFAPSERRAVETLISEGVKEKEMIMRRFLDMRYRGQEYTLPVPLTEDLGKLDELTSIRSRFNVLYQEHYGHSAPAEPVVIVNLRLTAIGASAKRLSLRASFREEDKGKKSLRPVTFDGAQGPVSCPVFLRSGLSAGERLQGPVVVEEIGSTILIYPGDVAFVNEFGHIIIDIGR